MQLLKSYLWSGLVTFSACLGCNPAPGSATKAQQNVVVSIAFVKPEKRVVRRVVEQPGSVQASEETVLYPKIAGFISSIALDPNKPQTDANRMIDIGSKVTRDQVLAELSIPELDEEFKQKVAVVRQLEAEIIQSRKALAAADAGIVSAQARVAEAKAGLSRVQAIYERWQSEMERVNRLVKGGVIDTQTRDETLNQFRGAEAGRHEADARVASAEATVLKTQADHGKAIADVTATEAKAEVARADVRRIEALRNYTRIKAPYDGVITHRAANTGDFLVADGKHSLFTVARTDPVRVVIHVPEADSGLITVGQEVQITIQTVSGPSIKGKVSRTSWSLEPGSRTLRVEADLPNIDGNLRPGMYVYARLGAELPTEWSLPSAAIGKVNEEPVAYLAENDKAVRVTVQLLRGDGQFTQVRSYKRGSSGPVTISGNEQFLMPASALSDGQSVPQK
ncbi:MAG: efflux RND transporter periplasmic adaptor subunit [Gemmatales bacterium]